MYRFCIILILFGVAFAKNEIFDGHSVYEVIVKDADQVEEVIKIENALKVEVLVRASPDRSGQFLVPEDQKEDFQNALTAAGIEYKLDVANVKELLDLEDRLLSEASHKSFNRSRSSGLAFDRIYEYHEIDAYLEDLAAAYPDLVTLVLGGYSFEGRAIKYLKISTTNFQDPNKPVVFIESLIHAREWVTLPATLYAIEKLVIDVQEQDLLQTIDWIVLPIANPDGYVYSHEINRLWRKNRAVGYIIADICQGVDLNRNFDVNWSIYSSDNVCSETFHGNAPFSESEATVISKIMLEHSSRLALFLDIHSFGSYILYGFGDGNLPSNALAIHVIGIEMANAIDNVKMFYNPNYVVGNSGLVLYEASGTASDYAQAFATPFAYTYELPGYRYGFGTGLGFLVDPDFIEQAGFETWQGIKTGARIARDFFLSNRGHKI